MESSLEDSIASPSALHDATFPKVNASWLVEGRECIKIAVDHYKAGNIRWPMFTYILTIHILGFLGMLRVSSCTNETILLAMLLYPLRYVAVAVLRVCSHTCLVTIVVHFIQFSFSYYSFYALLHVIVP